MKEFIKEKEYIFYYDDTLLFPAEQDITLKIHPKI